MSTNSSAVADLQSHWHTLHDLDRASAVFAIHRNGASLRELAKALNCSESLLRHLLAAFQAPPADRYLARQGVISTNELARRSKAAGIRSSRMHREAREFERAQAARQGCKTICDWLANENIQGGNGEQIIEEVRWRLNMDEQNGKLPRLPAPIALPIFDIIQRCRPTDPSIDDFSFVASYARWLIKWSFYALTDPWVRDRALELALSEQFKR